MANNADKPTALLASTAGAVAGLLPLGFVALATGIRPIVDNLFVIPVMQASNGRRLPLSQATIAVVCLLSVHLIACGIDIFAGIVDLRRRQRADKLRYLLLAAGLFSLGLTHQALQRAEESHIAKGVTQGTRFSAIIEDSVIL